MDTLILAVVALAGLCSYVFCTMRVKASFALALFSWLVAIPWLTVYSVRKLMTLDTVELVAWHGGAEMGPITLILAVIGLCLLTAGGNRHARKL